ncbi:MAG: type I methionyl aminopeptidase [Clostridiales bacterium]|jgi:methionyl aminopeptidase|nr:type I methionyl aminopeptidase [Clostridiales bacterium]HOB64189.1 type I methionyl aminopeptidase [Clostridia bacterium]HOK81954.1 type I methionyl aminopeptidase [Clostridia bacterium]HOL61232.1 type I methionyl aminopeptidase [Clostridia bacterium]HPO53910.1 type I methionyl aminopeptidase [Clostridia bacterium]
MISIKSEAELSYMRRAGAIVRDLLELMAENAKPGVTTRRLDAIAYDFIKKCNATPSFLGYGGFPGTICASIDSEIVHGIPGNRVLEEGMLLKVDAGACFNGFHADAARTFAIGKISEEKKKLMDVCRESFFAGISVLKDGARLGDLGYAIQSYVEKQGFSVVRELVGHGIGTSMHEDPSVPNYGVAGRGVRLAKNMTIAVEPMINMGTRHVRQLSDGWTVVTMDGKPSAHYENTVVIKEDGVEILTI